MYVAYLFGSKLENINLITHETIRFWFDSVLLKEQRYIYVYIREWCFNTIGRYKNATISKKTKTVINNGISQRKILIPVQYNGI